MRWALPAAGLAVAAVLSIVLGTALGWWNRTASDAHTEAPLSVMTSITPEASFFGDPVVAEVDVMINPVAVESATVRVDPVFTPFVATGAPSVGRTRTGRLEGLRYRYRLECLSSGCLPTGRPRVVQFIPVRVTASSGGTSLTKSASWPAARIASRLGQADVKARKPPFRSARTLPPPAYSTDPGRLADWLTAVAALLAAAGFVLVGLEGRRLAVRSRRRGVDRLGSLDAALLYTRDAARRPDPADRRKALNLLAQMLGHADEQLAGAAEELAWGEPPPTSERTLAIAEDVERNGGGRP
jgi:hypothetical protein